MKKDIKEKEEDLKDIKDRVKSYKDACKVLGEKPITNFGDATPDEIAYKKLKTVIKALNEGWTPKYTGKYNSFIRKYLFVVILLTQKKCKWYPCFHVESSSCKFFISYNEDTFEEVIHEGCTSSMCSHLCLKSKALSDYVGQQFPKLWKDFILEQ